LSFSFFSCRGRKKIKKQTQQSKWEVSRWKEQRGAGKEERGERGAKEEQRRSSGSRRSRSRSKLKKKQQQQQEEEQD
jgi:hypothetical protein